MKTLILSAAVALTVVSASAIPARAKGCIKGAVVGGVAGHVVHHGVLGAAGGCVVGHHLAAKRAEEQRQSDPEQR